MNKFIFGAVGIVILCGFVFIVDRFMSSTRNGFPKDPTEVVEANWKLLSQLDYKTGKRTDELDQLDRRKVKIPGYVVPLADNSMAIKEFLLVPNAQACIHVPPPPPNLIVHVILEEALPVQKIYNPAWITGQFRIETTESVYGSAAYIMKSAQLEEYIY